jgi:hypothetical protein
MRQETAQRGKLRASVERDYDLRSLDLFPDHTGRERDIDIVPKSSATFSDYLRDLLQSDTCPQCQLQQVKRYPGRNLKDWVLGFTGRRVFYCRNCGWTETVKVCRWDWEIVVTILATVAVVALFSIKWILG